MNELWTQISFVIAFAAA